MRAPWGSSGDSWGGTWGVMEGPGESWGGSHCIVLSCIVLYCIASLPTSKLANLSTSQTANQPTCQPATLPTRQPANAPTCQSAKRKKQQTSPQGNLLMRNLVSTAVRRSTSIYIYMAIYVDIVVSSIFHDILVSHVSREQRSCSP